MRRVLDAEPGVRVEYIAIAEPEGLGPIRPRTAKPSSPSPPG